MIGSHVAYAGVALPRLLHSLRRIDPQDILVVVGGCAREAEDRRDGILYWRVRHNSFDWTPLIELARRPTLWRDVFCLHDTMEAGPDFEPLARSGYDKAADATAVLPGGQCNLGMYRAAYLASMRGYLDSLENLSKYTGVIEEGVLFRKAPKQALYSISVRVSGPTDVYGTGTLRLAEHYAGLDLTKYKANWNGPHPPSGFFNRP